MGKNFTKEEILKLLEEARIIRLTELKKSVLDATKHRLETERQIMIQKIKRRQNEVRKFAALVKRKINSSQR